MNGSLKRLRELEPDRRGFADLIVSTDGLVGQAGRRWSWSDSRLSLVATGEADWHGEWFVGGGLRYEF